MGNSKLLASLAADGYDMDQPMSVQHGLPHVPTRIYRHKKGGTAKLPLMVAVFDLDDGSDWSCGSRPGEGNVAFGQFAAETAVRLKRDPKGTLRAVHGVMIKF